MNAYCCMYCLKDISRYNLDFKRDIVCGTCVQKLVGGKELPCFHPHKSRKIKKPQGVTRDE